MPVGIGKFAYLEAIWKKIKKNEKKDWQDAIILLE